MPIVETTVCVSPDCFNLHGDVVLIELRNCAYRSRIDKKRPRKGEHKLDIMYSDTT